MAHRWKPSRWRSSSLAAPRPSAPASWPAARRELEQIAAAAHRIGGTNLHERIPEVSRDVELHGVAGVLNGMLARLEAAFAAQQGRLLLKVNNLNVCVPSGSVVFSSAIMDSEPAEYR